MASVFGQGAFPGTSPDLTGSGDSAEYILSTGVQIAVDGEVSGVWYFVPTVELPTNAQFAVGLTLVPPGGVLAGPTIAASEAKTKPIAADQGTWKFYGFASPVAVSAGQRVQACVRTNRYALAANLFTSAPVVSGDLTAWQDAAGFPNGAFDDAGLGTDVGSVPTQSFGESFYGIDLEFTPTAVDPWTLVDFEEGTDGATIVAGGPYSSVNGAPTYSAADAVHGALAERATGTAAAVRVDNPGAGTHSGSVYASASGVASSAVRVVQFTSSTNAVLGALRFHSDGHIDISGTASNVRQAASLLSYVDGQVYRLDWQLDYSGANPAVTLRIFSNPEGAVPDETVGPVTISTTTLMQRWHLGALGGAAGQTVVVDTFRYANDLLWADAFEPGAPVAGSVAHAWVGAPTTDGFRVRARMTAATSVRLAVSTDAGMASPTYLAAQAPDAAGYVDFTATGLPAATQHYYQAADTPAGGVEELVGPIGKARTLAAGAGGFRFAFASCITNDAADPAALDSLRAWDPDLFLMTGDLHYRNPTSTDAAVHRGLIEAQIQGAAGLAQLLREVPTLYLRSDHDAGPGDNGDSGPEQPASIAAYEAVVPAYPLADSRSPRHGLYFAFSVRRVRFVVIDIRNTDRSPGADAQSSAKTMLGATQLAWLESELAGGQAVTVIVSDVAWLGVASTTNGPDKWWSYADERAAIGALCDGLNVLLLHGDSHVLGEAPGSSNPDGGFPVWCAAPLHNEGGGREIDQFRSVWDVGAGGTGRQYGRVTVTDDGSTIELALSGWDATTGVERIAATATFAPSGSPSWSLWDGTSELPLTLDGVWNGAAVDPVSSVELAP